MNTEVAKVILLDSEDFKKIQQLQSGTSTSEALISMLTSLSYVSHFLVNTFTEVKNLESFVLVINKEALSKRKLLNPNWLIIVMSKWSKNVEEFVAKEITRLYSEKTAFDDDQDIQDYWARISDDRAFIKAYSRQYTFFGIAPFHIVEIVLIGYANILERSNGSSKSVKLIHNADLMELTQKQIMDTKHKEEEVEVPVIDKVEKSLVEEKSLGGKELDNTEKIILVNLLQHSKLFPGYHYENDDKRLHQFIAILLGQPEGNIKKAQLRAWEILHPPKVVTKQKKRSNLKRLGKIKPIIDLLNNKEISTSLNDVVSKFK